MLWTCQSCGFYNDQSGPCCNCGKEENLKLETHNEIPDLLSSSYANPYNDPYLDLQTSNSAFLDHTNLDDPMVLMSNHGNIQNDVNYDGEGILDMVQDGDGGGRGDDDDDDILGDKHGKNNNNPIELKEKNNNDERHAFMRTEQDKSDSNSLALHINDDHYIQNEQLRYFMTNNYHFLRILLFYISSNLILTFISIITASLLIILLLTSFVDLPKDSTLEVIGSYSPYIALAVYLTYLLICFPSFTCFSIRRASIWSSTSSPRSPLSFVDFIASNAPSLTTPQINAIQHRLTTSGQSEHFLAFLHIPAQYHTRTDVIGIFYVPKDVNCQTGVMLDDGTLVGSDSPSTAQRQHSLTKNEQLYQGGGSGGGSMFLESFGENSGELKFLKIWNILSFLLVLEPILMPLAFALKVNTKYGIKIIKAKK
jgi:hypothetical protein